MRELSVQEEEEGRLLGKNSIPQQQPRQSWGQWKRFRRPVSPGTSLAVTMTLCCVSAMALVGFTFSHWSQPLPKLQIPNSAGTGLGPIEVESPSPAESPTKIDVTSSAAATSAATTPTSSTITSTPTPPSSIPPSEDFNLDKTGFVRGQPPTLREFAFNITWQASNPDGVSKPMILVNGQSPGPLIEANTGDTLRIAVHNSHPTASTTIHWHGIDQRNSTWMDGLFGVTQCAIPPGKSFVYEFALSDQRGTFWYHSHVTGQYTDGLFGPIVVHDADEKVPKVDSERLIMLGDLHHRTERDLLDEYLGRRPTRRLEGGLGAGEEENEKRHAAMAGMEPSPDNFVLNGRNVWRCTGDRAERQTRRRKDDGELTLAQCKTGSIYSTAVQTGQRLRLRLVSHSSNIPLWFTVDEHVLQIVEVDGVEVAPIRTSRVFLNPGQRYSVVLEANQPAGNYVIRASAARRCSMVRFADQLENIHYEATGVLSYDNTDATAPPRGQPFNLASERHPDIGDEPWAARSCEDMPFGLAKPMRAIDAFGISDGNQHHIPFEMRRSGNALLTFIGDTVFKPLKNEAVLWSADKAGQDAGSSLPWHFAKEQHVFVSEEDGGAQVAISALNMMTHPWHLHGQTFQIVGWGPGAFGAGTTVWNRENPLRRDTITVPGNTHVVLRIKADNPGIWALHCHIQWHAEGGMFALVAQKLRLLHKQVEQLTNLPHLYCNASKEDPAA